MIPSERAHLFTAAITHPGMTGKSNEDRYAITAYRLDDERNTPAVFAIIADGVGGHKAGEVAAEIAVNTISHAVALSDGTQPQETLEDAIIQAGKDILGQSHKDEAQQGMGSTCICAWIIDERLYMAAVGDSRLYLLRGGEISQLSIDHTWVQEALDHGIIKPEQARNHPRSHIIRRYLGSKNAVIPDLRLKLTPEESDQEAVANQGFPLVPGDQVLLCSDGLSDLVEDHEMHEILTAADLAAALETMVDLANARGGHDNITILALKVSTPEEQPGMAAPPKPTDQPNLLPWITCAVFGLITTAVILLAILGIWFFNRADGQPMPTATPDFLPPAATLTLPPTEIHPTETPLPSETPIQPTLTPWPTNPPEN